MIYRTRHLNDKSPYFYLFLGMLKKAIHYLDHEKVKDLTKADLKKLKNRKRSDKTEFGNIEVILFQDLWEWILYKLKEF